MAIALIGSGCGDDAAKAPKDAPSRDHETEVVFLAQYEKLRTDASPGTGSRPTMPAPPPREFRTPPKFQACVERAVRAMENAGPPPASGPAADAWHAEFAATHQQAIEGCDSLLPDGAAFGYGRVFDAAPFATPLANASGAPVDVEIY